jgi:predicted Zn-ribbon and HTH transcriptional regulator
MKMTRMTWIALGGLGVALVAWAAVALLSDVGTRTGPAVTDNTHCPECGRELPRTVRDAGGECPYCKMQGKSVTVGKGRGGPSALRGPAVPLVFLGIVTALVLIHVAFLVRQRLRGRQEEVLYHTNCRKCMRKLRYRPRQIGQLARCPICRTLIRFPEPEEAARPRWTGALLGKIRRR